MHQRHVQHKIGQGDIILVAEIYYTVGAQSITRALSITRYGIFAFIRYFERLKGFFYINESKLQYMRGK